MGVVVGDPYFCEVRKKHPAIFKETSFQKLLEIYPDSDYLLSLVDQGKISLENLKTSQFLYIHCIDNMTGLPSYTHLTESGELHLDFDITNDYQPKKVGYIKSFLLLNNLKLDKDSERQINLAERNILSYQLTEINNKRKSDPNLDSELLYKSDEICGKLLKLNQKIYENDHQPNRSAYSQPHTPPEQNPIKSNDEKSPLQKHHFLRNVIKKAFNHFESHSYDEATLRKMP